jgi:hypothetical protein
MPCIICGKGEVSHRMSNADRNFVGYICDTCYRGMARDPMFERDSCKYCPAEAQFGTLGTASNGGWEPLVCEDHYEQLTSYP